jgi:hypothetical protein
MYTYKARRYRKNKNMHNEQSSISKSNTHSLSPRDEQLLRYLEEVWQHPNSPSPETVKRVIKFLSSLPEPYRTTGMTKIAEHLASNIGIYFLDLMATFQQKAESEGISQKECQRTIQGVMPELFPEMMSISKRAIIRSLDDMITFSNISFGLYTLSQAETAEDAQGWIYELPTLYRNQLNQEGLISPIQPRLTAKKKIPAAIRFRETSSWVSSLPEPVHIRFTSSNEILR